MRARSKPRGGLGGGHRVGTGCHWSFALWVPCGDGCRCAVWPLSRVWETVPGRRPDRTAGSEAALLTEPRPLHASLGGWVPSEWDPRRLLPPSRRRAPRSSRRSHVTAVSPGPGPPSMGRRPPAPGGPLQICRLPGTDHVASEPTTAPINFRRSLNNGLSRFFV